MVRVPAVTIADLITAVDQSGCNDLSKSTMPETWGVAMDVPDWISNATPLLGGTVASILTPGAATSGCII